MIARTVHWPLACLVVLLPAALQGDSRDAALRYHPVKALLTDHCVKCHGTQRQEAGLRLDSTVGIQRGSDHGPILDLSSPNTSRLILAIEGQLRGTQRMPAKNPPLSAEQIELIRTWVRTGAPGPTETEAPVESTHWAFRSIKKPALPPLKHDTWVRNPIDCFILSALDDQGLLPSPPADKATLARRVALDLTGVPLSPEEWDRFMNHQGPHAYEQLVDRLLASPHYGERWGRHWLDQARYADSNGFTRDFAREIWKYRDWVIDTINRNIPFNQFTVEQMAGDMLPNATLEQQIATGFHRNTLINEEGGTDPEQFRVDAIADRVATTSSVFLGLTLECARCHPHKYDPISQREYYEVFALLNNCDEPKIDAPSFLQTQRGDLKRRDQIRERIQDLNGQLTRLGDPFLQAQLEWEATITPEFRATLLGPVQAALDLAPEERSDEQKTMVRELYQESESARNQFDQIREIVLLKNQEPIIPTSLVLQERTKPRETHVHRRGNFLDPGPAVTPNTPGVLPPLRPRQTRPTRLDFGRWLVSTNNPLTARVTVNRAWQRFFGRGIVMTDNDFGIQGERPTHPQLLDWLASTFMDLGWDSKQLHRLIVTSAAYRQSSAFRGDLRIKDPANRWLARQSRIRLDAEIIRDGALAVADLLTPIIGGPSVYPPQPEGVFEFTQDPKPWPTAQGADRYRRGLYTYLWRSSPYPAFAMFDAPDGNTACTQRNRSNTPMQALTLANDIQFIEAARSVAQRTLDTGSRTLPDLVEGLYKRCLSRVPTDAERATLVDLMAKQMQGAEIDPENSRLFVGDALWEGKADHALTAATVFAARVLLNTDEFITRE